LKGRDKSVEKKTSLSDTDQAREHEAAREEEGEIARQSARPRKTKRVKKVSLQNCHSRGPGLVKEGNSESGGRRSLKPWGGGGP